MRILLLEADRKLTESLSALLAGENFAVELAADGESGLANACTGEFDLIILGSTSPSLGSTSPSLGSTSPSLGSTSLNWQPQGCLGVCAQLRAKGIDTSILMLTEERVAGLKIGADDCVPRTCDANELLARIEALLRRAPGARKRPASTLRFGDVEVDFAIGEARKCGRPVRISAKEVRLLEYLAAHTERVVSRKEILRNVWEYDVAVSSRTVDVHIGWLRQKLESNPQAPAFIKTVRGRGYRFDCQQPVNKISAKLPNQ